MEPLYRGILERARKHIPFYDFVRDHFTRHYIDRSREFMGEEGHHRDVINAKNGVFDKNPSLFMKLHEDLGQRFGIPPEPSRRDPNLQELYVLRINPKYAAELAEEMARVAVAAEKFYGKPFWKIPTADAVSILKNAMLTVHKRYEDRESVLIGPENV